jgi:hypothetical protein
MAVTTVRDDALIHGGHGAGGQGPGNGGQVADGGDGHGNSGEHGHHGGQPVPSFWNFADNQPSQNGGHQQFKLTWHHA